MPASLPPDPSDPPAAGAWAHETPLGRLVVADGAPRAAELEALAARAAVYATRARGDGTLRTYRSAWQHYDAWCTSLGRDPLAGDLDTLAMYVVRRADDGLAVSSLRVALAAIGTAHRLAGIPLDLRQPRFAMVLDGIVRSRGTRPRRQAIPAVPDLLRAMLGTLSPDPAHALAARNRALLLLGFSAALRRSELVALRLGDVTPVPGRGLRLLVRRSKTDPYGAGQDVAIWATPADPLLCPAAALAAWLAHRNAADDLTALSAAERAERPLFCGLTKAHALTGQKLSDKAVVRLVKQTAAAAGLDARGFSGHSLRAGLATAAAENGAGLAELMRQTRHTSVEVALSYLRPADLWRRNVTEGLLGPHAQETP